jgi:hypothetical protein
LISASGRPLALEKNDRNGSKFVAERRMANKPKFFAMQ